MAKNKRKGGINIEGADVTISGDVVGGDKNIFQGVDRKTLWFIAGFLAVIFIALLVGFALLLLFNPDIRDRVFPQPMQGRFNIAVAGFVTNDASLESFRTLAAKEIARELEFQFAKSEIDIEIWNANRTGKIEGATAEARAMAAARRAYEINAHMIVYGTVFKSGNLTIVVPEFYLRNQNFFASQELTGQYELGAPIELQEHDVVAMRTKLGDELVARTQTFARISTGLAYALDTKFEEAQREFEAALEAKDLSETNGKQVLYLMIGNLLVAQENSAAEQENWDLVQEKLDKATEMYQQALALDSEYARPYIGLGNIAFLRALHQAKEVHVLTQHLAEAEQNFLNARQAKHQPALSDIESKVHFGLGQVQMLRGALTQPPDFAPAITEYQSVITDFETNKNPRLTWYAAQAHARLGAIAQMEKRCDEAKRQYTIAQKLHENTKEGGDFKFAKQYKEKTKEWNSSSCPSAAGELSSE